MKRSRVSWAFTVAFVGLLVLVIAGFAAPEPSQARTARASPSSANTGGTGWAETRVNSAFHTDTIADRVQK